MGVSSVKVLLLVAVFQLFAAAVTAQDADSTPAAQPEDAANPTGGTPEVPAEVPEEGSPADTTPTTPAPSTSSTKPASTAAASTPSTATAAATTTAAVTTTGSSGSVAVLSVLSALTAVFAHAVV